MNVDVLSFSKDQISFSVFSNSSSPFNGIRRLVIINAEPGTQPGASSTEIISELYVPTSF